MTEAVFTWEPRPCSHKGCRFYGKHVENCYRCAGFGHWRGTKGDTFIIAQEADDHIFKEGEYTPCSMCGGKPMRVA